MIEEVKPRRCVRCHMGTVLTCANDDNPLCSYCQEESPLCPSCRVSVTNPSPIPTISLFSRLNQEAMQRESRQGGNQCP
jgi:hypothetical protein